MSAMSFISEPHRGQSIGSTSCRHREFYTKEDIDDMVRGVAKVARHYRGA